MNLVTGATGLVGAHVALMLIQQNKPVIAIKRYGSDILKTKNLFSYYTDDYEILFEKIKWVEADVSDIYSLLDALDNIDIVYHCAGFVSFDSKDGNQMNIVNTIGTANLVNACLEKKIKALCHVSSIATLQNPDITTNIDELVYWKSSPTASDYAISKYNGEREVWRGIEEGLNAVIVNPGIVLGPGFWNQSSGRLITTCFKGNPFYTNGSSATIDARDVAYCMIQLIEKEKFGNRFVLTEGNYSFKELLSLICKGLNKKEPSIRAGFFLLQLGKWLDTLKHLVIGSEKVITSSTINSSIERNSFKNSKIREAISINFIPLRETITFVSQVFLKEKKIL